MENATIDLSTRSVRELLEKYRAVLPQGVCFFLGKDGHKIEEMHVPAPGPSTPVTFGFLEDGCPQEPLLAGKAQQQRYPFSHHIASTSKQFQENLAAHLRARLAMTKKHLLIVDDDPEICSLIAAALEHEGFAVLTASSGADAVKLIDTSGDSIDVLVTDLVMPMLNGAELAKIALFGHPNMRVIYMSGYPDDVVDRYGVAKSGARYIKKPFSPSVLEQVVREELYSASL